MHATRVFIHGLESSGRGVKGSYFRRRYPGMIIGDFTGPLARKMAQMERILGDREELILVGSSYGGLMASLFACEQEHRVKKMILLAPAIGLPAFAPCLKRRLSVPVHIFHGSRDEVLDAKGTRAIARRVFSTLTFTIVDDDHSLHRTFETFDWDALLETGGTAAEDPREIVVNGKREKLPAPVSLEDFLKGKAFDREGVVVELNRQIVTRESWSTTTIRENDVLEILRFIGGGEAPWRTA